jgi:ATP-dependent DNA ligase
MLDRRPKPPAGGIKATFPGFIEPALATSIGKVPNGDRWVHEIKFDGYRVQVHLRDAAVKVFTRRGNDWTNRFRKIAADAWHINAGSAIIDGEVVVPADRSSARVLRPGDWPCLSRRCRCRCASADSRGLRPGTNDRHTLPASACACRARWLGCGLPTAG